MVGVAGGSGIVAGCEVTVESLVAYDSWGRYPASVPSQVIVLDEQPTLPARWETTLLPYGNGCSYGDVCLNNGGTLLVTRAANTLLDADWERGVVRCQAGMTIGDLNSASLPHGWLVPVEQLQRMAWSKISTSLSRTFLT